MHRRKDSNGRGGFDTLVREARMERAVYLSEALAQTALVLRKQFANALSALRSRFGALATR